MRRASLNSSATPRPFWLRFNRKPEQTTDQERKLDSLPDIRVRFARQVGMIFRPERRRVLEAHFLTLVHNYWPNTPNIGGMQ